MSMKKMLLQTARNPEPDSEIGNGYPDFGSLAVRPYGGNADFLMASGRVTLRT